MPVSITVYAGAQSIGGNKILNVLRTVTENARTLKFKNQSFEAD